MCVNAREFLYTNTLCIARRGKRASERERMAEREGRRCVSACSGIINAPFCLLSPCFLFNYAMSRTRLAVNWFNYPICLWQAWFQPNCSSCGRRWQTAMWRRRTARPITVTGVWTCRPPPPFPSKTTTSMDPPTASTSATRSRERGKITQPLTWEFGRRLWFLGQSEHSLRHCWNLSIYIQLDCVLGIIEQSKQAFSVPLLKVEIAARKAKLMDRYQLGISCKWIVIYCF